MGSVNLLDGVRILDLSKASSVPFGTQILGDLGAEVIKIEEPPGGPFARAFAEPHRKLAGGMDASFLSVNRNKQSVVLQLSDREGLATFHRLVEKADVVVDNYRPGVAEKLEVDYETLKRINPRIISCSLTGYGVQEPLARRTAFDITVLAESGMLEYVDKRDGVDRLAYPRAAVADLSSGMYCAIGISAALVRQRVSDEGCQINLTMYDSVLSWYITEAVLLLNGQPRSRYFDGAIWGAFDTETIPVVVAAHRDNLWERFCRAIERTEWLEDPRFGDVPSRARNIDQLKELISADFRTKPASDWIEALSAHGVPCGEVHTPEEALESPEAAARDMIVEVEYPQQTLRMVGNPLKVAGVDPEYSAPPIYGRDTETVLRKWLDYSDEDIEALTSRWT